MHSKDNSNLTGYQVVRLIGTTALAVSIPFVEGKKAKIACFAAIAASILWAKYSNSSKTETTFDP